MAEEWNSPSRRRSQKMLSSRLRVPTGDGVASAYQDLSGNLFHGFDALGDGGGAHSQDICRRVEGAVFNDGGEGGELVGTETCHKNILRSVKIFR